MAVEKFINTLLEHRKSILTQIAAIDTLLYFNGVEDTSPKRAKKVDVVALILECFDNNHVQLRYSDIRKKVSSINRRLSQSTIVYFINKLIDEGQLNKEVRPRRLPLLSIAPTSK